MDSLGDSVWERGGASTLDRRMFVLVMGFFTLAGLAVTAYFASYTTGWMELVPGADGKTHPNWIGPLNFWIFWGGVFVTTIIGVLIALKSDEPIISTFGYFLVAAPFGLLLGPTVGMYTPESVVKVMFITGTMTAVLTVIGALYPKSLESWGIFLFGGLIVLIVGQFGLIVAASFGVPVGAAMTALDWVGVLLFSGYIIFDMNRAMRVPSTLDNAIDCALALYLDIINLFILLLRIMGQRK